MFEHLVLSAAVCGGAPYNPGNYERPIASLPAYPYNMADDVHRPGFNGRLYVTRPIIGDLRGHYAYAQPTPGPEYYGAYLSPCESVPVRVGLLTISVSPWAQWTQQGHDDIEYARQFWLKEHGYTGGVRTFVNDLHLFEAVEATASEPRVEKSSNPEPAAIIELAPDAPRQKRRMRVDAAPARDHSAAAAILRRQGPMHISWPANAPGQAVARTEASGGTIDGGIRPRVITASR
jgi:hypothetical protein